MRETAVVLVSGGMDSCVTAAIAKQNYELAFLHLNYGQKTERRELQAFHDIAAHYKVDEARRLVVDMAHFSVIGGSSLTDASIEVEKANLVNPGIPSSYVPFRNANILAIAVSYAEVISASKIFIGAVEEDSSGYPDCRAGFFKAFNEVIKQGTAAKRPISIETPLIQMSKKEIIEKGLKLKAPLELSWSCYKNEDKACGICDSCALRLRGFKQAAVRDPLPYEQRPDYS